MAIIVFEHINNPRGMSHKNIYFDTLVHDSFTLELMKKSNWCFSNRKDTLINPYPLRNGRYWYFISW